VDGARSWDVLWYVVVEEPEAALVFVLVARFVEAAEAVEKGWSGEKEMD